MLSYLDTKNVLFTRGISFDIKQYLFVAQVVLGEDVTTAYAMIYDRDNFVKQTGTEDEEEYLNTHRRDAEILLEKQNCAYLKEYIEQELQSYVQDAATKLEDFKFTGADVQRLLGNLLHNRSESLDDASVRDILSLIKGMYESGALDSGDSFSRHFITLHDPFNALCTNCGHEFEAHAGIDIVCPHCKQVYKWSETERRFYPKFSKL